MSMAYIRELYGVPAKRGGEIVFTEDNGDRYRGTIVGSRGGRIRVRILTRSGPSGIATLHPTWNVEYLNGEGNGHDS